MRVFVLPRKIPKNYMHVTGEMSSRHGPTMGFEGGVEKDFYALMEHQPAITRIDTQTITFEYVDVLGKKRSYTPEALITFCPKIGRRPMLVEIKDRATLRAEFSEFRERFKAGIRFSREHGYDFRIYTDVEIQTPYLANIKQLRVHRDHLFSSADIERLQRLIRESPAIDVRAVITSLNGPSDQTTTLSLLYHALSRGHISADLFRPVDYGTALYLPEYWIQRPWKKSWLRQAIPTRPAVRRGW